jgi:putative transcriptional regulator
MAKKKQERTIEINRIRVVLSELNMSHKEFAEKIDLVPATISRICNNRTQPSLKLLREIALTLDVDITELLVHTKKSN